MECSLTMGVVSHGVPQGSCLGPLLFLTYINDLTAYIPEEALYLYADDTAVVASSPSLVELNDKLQAFADGLQQWCLQGRLNINVGKSKVMLFGAQKTDSLQTPLCFLVGQNLLEWPGCRYCY